MYLLCFSYIWHIKCKLKNSLAYEIKCVHHLLQVKQIGYGLSCYRLSCVMFMTDCYKSQFAWFFLFPMIFPSKGHGHIFVPMQQIAQSHIWPLCTHICSTIFHLIFCTFLFYSDHNLYILLHLWVYDEHGDVFPLTLTLSNILKQSL